MVKKRSPGEILYGFWRLAHPGPVFFHLIAVMVFTLLAAWPQPVWPLVFYVVAAHTAMQLAIAVFNDYCDREKDARGKPEKPIPRGLVAPREALFSGYVLIAIMALLLLPLPPLAGLLSLLYLTLGMAYNLGLKGTPFSGVVFALAMPLIPLYAFSAIGRTLPFLFWLIPVGFALGVALNLANSLPDLEEDAAAGVKTLAVALGVKRAFLVANVLPALCALLILGLHLGGILSVQPLVLVGTLLLTLLGLGALLLISFSQRSSTTRKIYFYLMVIVCIILAGGWFVGVLV